MLYYELLEGGATVTASLYGAQMDKLAQAMREKRPRRVYVHLLHDNARPHVAKLTQKKLLELGWDTVPHPPYSPDLAPCDYHHFGPLERFLHNKNSETSRTSISTWSSFSTFSAHPSGLTASLLSYSG